MIYRNRAILDLAEEHSCQLCRMNDNTVVAAHSNSHRHGKGMAIKAQDCFVAYLCARCHTAVDQGSDPRYIKDAMWETAFKRSIPLFSHLLGQQGEILIQEAGYGDHLLR